MAKILVHTAFNLTITPSQRKHFAAGVHEGVPLEEATHWYAKEHSTLLSEDDDTPVEALAPEPLSVFQRDAAVSRLVHLFRTTMLTLTDEQLMETLANAERHAQQTIARAADAGHDLDDLLAQHEPQPTAETEGGEDKVPEPVEIVPSVEPEVVAEPVEPVVEVVAETPPEFDPALVEAMTDVELRAYITKRDRKAPHHNMKRENLIALALAPAAGETAEPEEAAETEGGEA